MNIISDSANFSNVGLGRVVTEVSSEVEALLSGYENLPLSMKLKFQAFIDSIGGLSGNIWSGINMLLVPYFANTVNEAYFDVKLGSIRNPGSSGHKAACSPIRGEGATYNTSSYNNALNFAGVIPENSRFIGVCEKVKGFGTGLVGLLEGGASGSLGRFVKTARDGTDISMCDGITVGGNSYYGRIEQTIPVVGNHALLKALANDQNITKNSYVLVADNVLVNMSELPDGQYTSEDIPWYGTGSGYKFTTTGVDYDKNVFSMFVIGGNLSKAELLTLNTAMYAFCRYNN